MIFLKTDDRAVWTQSFVKLFISNSTRLWLAWQSEQAPIGGQLLIQSWGFCGDCGNIGKRTRIWINEIAKRIWISKSGVIVRRPIVWRPVPWQKIVSGSALLGDGKCKIVIKQTKHICPFCDFEIFKISSENPPRPIELNCKCHRSTCGSLSLRVRWACCNQIIGLLQKRGRFCLKQRSGSTDNIW